MIDVSHKFQTLRYAKAEGVLHAPAEIIARVKDRTVPKGDVLATARCAGISAAKRTADWIVLCHPIPLDWVDLSFEIAADRITVSAEVRAIWKTGVEMEAITAVSAALLNMYDMLKPLSDDLSIGEIRVVRKKGGKSDYSDDFSKPLKTAILVISDATYAGKREDKAGKVIQKFLQDQAVEVKTYEILPDDQEKISDKLRELVDKDHMDLIFTTGGTSVGTTDVTPEATRAVIDKEMPGISEALRKYGKDRTPYAMLSREVSGVRKHSLIVNLPGSSRGAKESLQALFPGLLHSFGILWREKP
jgi:molybdenum cofactor biosynthesis protein MoaC